MPIKLTHHETPKGHRYARTHSSGVVTGEEAEAVMAQLVPGQPGHAVGVLSVVDPGTEMRPEARRAFTSSNGLAAEQLPVAIVVTSAPLRVTLSFVMRVVGTALKTRFFATEAEALVWLETTLDERPV
mgnify:CR=1 FL=1